VGEKIRFGLAGIKGVGEAASQKIIEEREAHGPYKDFADFISRIDSRSANKRVLEHLVKTGAFDYAGTSRKDLFDGIDAALAQAAAHARDRAAGQNSFFDMLAEPEPATKPLAARAGKSPEITRGTEDFSDAEKLQFEKELLGFYVSGHPMSVYSGLAEAIDTYTAEELLQINERLDFRLCGIASNITKRLSKKDGRPWAAFNVATRRASVSLNMFSEAYENYGAHLVAETSVLVQGNIIVGADGPRINVRECYPLESALPSTIRSVTWLLKPDHPELSDFLTTLRKTVEKQSGDTRLRLGFLFPDRVAALSEISTALNWRVSAADFQKLRAHPAVAGMQIETRPLELKQERRRTKRG